MTKPMIRIYTGTTEFIDREMNADEFAQYKLDRAQAEARETEVTAKATAKAAAQSKLAALGLTVADLEALGL